MRRSGTRHPARPPTPLGSALRRALLMLGLGALLCGAVWSVASVTRPPAELVPSATALLPDSDRVMPCLSVRAREEMERESCFHSVQREMIEGRLGLREAIARLEACGASDPEMRLALDRHGTLRLEERRARIAFGLPVGALDGVADAEGIERLGVTLRPPRPGAVARLGRRA